MKVLKKVIVMIFSVYLFIFIVSCNYNGTLGNLNKNLDYSKVDVSGNAVKPFDVINSEAFENNEFDYVKDQILVKMGKNYFGKITKNLSSCGIKNMDKFSESEDGNWWVAELEDGFDAKKSIKLVRELEEVLFADFDYIYLTENSSEDINSASETESVNDVSWAHKDVHGNEKLHKQYYLKHNSIQKSWKYLEDNGKEVGGDSSVVIAVIDTGVDYNHPDLKANMWVNMGEIAGNGIDDDKNGYIDDVHGANVVANNGSADKLNTGNPMDDHGHGTHVAGIIAASNNKEGIVGIAYNCKIMAVKAGQASGVFTQSDIAEAILYAYEMGADVINMSFGGASCSVAVEEALSTAYTQSVLVASAGNDGLPNEVTKNYDELPNYPAALSYVIGVMSVGQNNVESPFTNWDASSYNKVEYEVYAPGEDILSTLPNGRYGELSGTSMAAPIVSATAALIRSYFTDRDMYPSKYIAGQICSTSETKAICLNKGKHDGNDHINHQIVDLYSALTKLPKPDVNLYDRYIFDSESLSDENNGDGVIDAGETLAIGAVLRNRWGMSKDTIVTIDNLSESGVANPYVEIVSGTANFDGVGTYSTKDTLVKDNLGVITGIDNPLVIKIADNCPNDYKVVLNVTITYKNGLDDKDVKEYVNKGQISFTVRNGVVLTGQITEDMTLTSDNYYIIPSMLYVCEGVTLTIEEGTNIQFWSSNAEDQYAETGIASIVVAGSMIVNGTYENPVNIFPSDYMSIFRVEISNTTSGYIELNYTNIKNPFIEISEANNCNFSNVYSDKVLGYKSLSGSTVVVEWYNGKCSITNANNCVFKDLFGGAKLTAYEHCDICGDFKGCIFINSRIEPYCLLSLNSCIFEDTIYRDLNGLKQTSLADIYFSQLYNNDNNQKSYIEVKFPYSGLNNYDYLLVESFIEKLGGSLVCFETKEEYNEVINNINIEGAAVDIKNTNNNLDSFVLNHNYGFITIDTNYKKTKAQIIRYAIFEIPYLYDDNGKINELTKEFLKTSLNDFYNTQENSSLFSNNVILNNLNDSEMTKWFVLNAGENISDEKYLRTINLNNNYWGTNDIDLINKQILDFDDYATLADINIDNFLTEAPSDTFPFVVDAYLLNSNGERARTVSNEKVTFVVEFNRDMDVSVPLNVRFGSSEPYGEYQIEGEYVNPRRWEGTYTLKTTIENGNQTINISNGKAADDDLDLYDVPGRFMFEIDTTAAQAMIMQATATETGINLNWMQDDFDTLLGYNVYKSNVEDGLYVRLNDYVLAPSETTFFDDTVEPGKVYYYNFTVVKTDLTESTPSGKVVVRSMDTMAPDIYHSPVRTAYTGNKLIVSATITDNLQILSARLYYRVVGASSWNSVEMTNLNSKYSGIIGSDYITMSGLEYYIEAYDGISYTYKGTEDSPYLVTVKLAIDANSLGDVDGDGIISVKDAQMLLMAINDLLNLSEEEFKRADIDSNGKLEAFEAMRILDYISGKVTTIGL